MKDLTDPTNRDSVPAILTPGEYVLNKEATEMYGPIIEQMNENGLAARTEGNMGVLSLNTGGPSLRPKARPKEFNGKPLSATFDDEFYYNSAVRDFWSSKYQTDKDFDKEHGFDQHIKYKEYHKQTPIDALKALDTASDIFAGDEQGLSKELLFDMGTKIGAHESSLTGPWSHNKQGGGGPGRSYWQVEPSTMHSLLNDSGAIFGPKFEKAFSRYAKDGKTAKKYLADLPLAQKSQLLLDDPALGATMALGKVTLKWSSLDINKDNIPVLPKAIEQQTKDLILISRTGEMPKDSVVPSQEVQLDSTPTVPQQVPPDGMPQVPQQEQPVVMPQAPQQVQPSPPLEAPVQGHPDAGVFVPDFAPQQELIPNPSYSPPGTIKEESNPQLRNEIYLGPETNTRPLEIKNPTGEVSAEDADDGFSWSDYFRDSAISTFNYLVPRQYEMQVVPSVAGDVQQDLYRRGPSQYVGGMVFNQGGPVQHLNPGGRAGGKKKVWDSATQSYIWVGPSDPRHPGNAPTINEDRVPRVNPNPAPFTFDLTPNIPVRPGQDNAVQPTSNTMVPPSPLNIPTMPNPTVDAEPIVVDTAPAPMSDEALLNTSSQVVEQREDSYPNNAQPGWRNLREGGQWQNPQAVPAPSPENIPMLDEDEANRLKYNAQLREYARQFPEGDPRRIEAFNNVLHERGAAHPSYVNDRPIESGLVAQAPPVPPQPSPINYSQLSEDALITLSDDGDETASDEIRRRNDLVNVVDPIIEDQRNLGYTDLTAPGIHDSRPDIGNLGPGIYAEADHLGALSPGVIAELGPENVPTLDGTVIPSTHELALIDPSSPGTLDTLALADVADVNATVDFDDPRGPDQRQTVEQAQDSSQREATVRSKVAEVDEGEGPASNISNDEAASKGATVIAENPAEESKAMSAIKGFFGDLFTADELKRAAVLFVGAMLTGATPGQALAFAGKDYLSRGDAHSKYVKELMEEGDHTTASIKAYSKSKNLEDLVPKQAMRSGTGNYKNVWSPDGKRIRAMEVSLGPRNNIWVNSATGLKIPDAWEDDPKNIPNTPESNEAIRAAGKNYGDMVNELQRTHASIEDSNKTLTELSPNLEGGKIAKWARDNNIDASEMPTIIENAYMDLLRDVKGGGKVAKDIRPYLNNQYVTAKAGGAPELFTLTTGDNAGQRMSAEKISGVLATARSITSRSDDPSIKNRGDVEIIKAVIVEWEKLVDKSKYKASSTETPFFKFLKEQINSG